MMHEQTHCHDEAASHQLFIAVADWSLYFWVIQIVCGKEMFKLDIKVADSLLYLLSHFECNGHTVHMLTQCHLLPPMTSTVKSSLFTHVNFRPLFLAAGLHQCRANHSHYINNGWNFSKLSLYTILIKDNKFVEKCQEKGIGFWALRGGKLWEGKYMEKIMETRGFLVKFVQAHFGANIPFSNGN